MSSGACAQRRDDVDADADLAQQGADLLQVVAMAKAERSQGPRMLQRGPVAGSRAGRADPGAGAAGPARVRTT